MSRTPNLNLWTYNHTDAFWWEWNVKLIYKNDFSKEIFRTKTVVELITQLTSEKKIKVLLSSRHETANSCKPRRITCKNKLAWNFISQQWQALVYSRNGILPMCSDSQSLSIKVEWILYQGCVTLFKDWSINFCFWPRSKF